MEEEATPFYVSFLQEQLDARKRKNKAYSLRAFATNCQVDPSSLSRILLSKESISLGTAEKIVHILKLSDEEKRLFLSSVATEKCEMTEKRLAQVISKNDLKPIVNLIDAKTFATISDFFDLAIVEVVSLDACDSSPKWIADYLDISEEKVSAALERLVNAGLITVSDGRYERASEFYNSEIDPEFPEPFAQYQKSILTRAMESVDRVRHDKRPTSTMTMAIDPKKIPIAKKMIESFMLSMCDFLETENKTQVYQAVFTLFPVGKNYD